MGTFFINSPGQLEKSQKARGLSVYALNGKDQKENPKNRFVSLTSVFREGCGAYHFECDHTTYAGQPGDQA